MFYQKYQKYIPISLPDRKWPSKTILKAPRWCSVDLRDGNQALPVPMSVQEKLDYYHLLLKIGFKEIEVGFPSASETEYRFLRNLIEDSLIPEGVAVQVLTQARKHLIEKTFESLQGAKNAVVHLYNSTSTLQRKVVFNKDKKEIIEIAKEGAFLIKELAVKNKETKITYQYSPESFTGTEMDFALEICEEVLNILKPTPENPVILNLPATVEMTMPNLYADQIEWFIRNISCRDKVLISVHTHNDRGTGVAATELALLAGADRVEGTLFGNGERTGNLDIITVALNLLTQGIDPQLDFSNMAEIIEIYEACTKLPVHPRHPYAGDLVYTAFSGSHQDAIRKGLMIYQKEKPKYWQVPYLPIDPADVGRKYEAVIRINSQSGRGGVAYIMETEFGFKLPKEMHAEFGTLIKKITDDKGIELSGQEIYEEFHKEYFYRTKPIQLLSYRMVQEEGVQTEIDAEFEVFNEKKSVVGKGNGPIDAFFNALSLVGYQGFKFVSFDEHALTSGSDSKAVSYIQIEDKKGQRFFGVGVNSNSTRASFLALICAVNRSLD